MLKGFIFTYTRIVNTIPIAEKMVIQARNKLTLTQFRAVFNKWRVAFVFLAFIYFVFLLLNLTNQPLNWDEISHLNRALALRDGLFNNFVRDSFYPPLYSCLTMLSFNLLGASVFSARLVSAVFSILSLWVTFELANSMYGKKAALLSFVFLAIMPGFFWLSRLALLEVMLVFFFTLSLFFFYRWFSTRKDIMLLFSGLALGFGFLTKYQVIAASLVMIITLMVLGRGQLKRLFSRFSLLITSSLVVVVPWFIIVFNVFSSYLFSQWMYALQMGNPERSLYSNRFPIPIFYFIEMTWPYGNIHPISLLLYIVGLAGLGLFFWRRKQSDKFVLVWFFTVFIFFTLISNREWRYVLTLLPTLAISSSTLVLFAYDKIHVSSPNSLTLNKKTINKAAAGLLTILLFVAATYSISNIYQNVKENDITIEIKNATDYALSRINDNQSIMVLCPFNFFNQDMVQFYLWAGGKPNIKTYQYPTLAVDTYTPNFNITELTNICRQNNVKYLFTYENGGETPYFNTTLTLVDIYIQLYESKNFSEISQEATFGFNPRRIIILTFLG